MNVILIGLRGSGKTTLGRALAARLGRAFVDLDDLTPAALGCATAADAWTRHGEAAFRAAELAAMEPVIRRDDQVIALGGGTPTAPGAADRLRAERAAGRARVVYLSADAAALRARLRTTDLWRRPSLTGAEPLGEIDAVLAARDALYRRLADVVIETAGMDEARALESLAAAAAGW